MTKTSPWGICRRGEDVVGGASQGMRNGLIPQGALIGTDKRQAERFSYGAPHSFDTLHSNMPGHLPDVLYNPSCTP